MAIPQQIEIKKHGSHYWLKIILWLCKILFSFNRLGNGYRVDNLVYAEKCVSACKHAHMHACAILGIYDGNIDF